MRKISFALLGAMLIVLSCNKNEKETPLTTPEQVPMEAGRKCAADEVLQAQIKTNPRRGQFLDELETKTQNFKGFTQSQFRVAGKLYVPIVVNIVLPDASLVSDAQIQSQLDVLNKDFNKANIELSSSSVYLANYAYNNVANCQLEFYIQNASTDVRRKNSTVATFSTDDAVKKTLQGGLDPLNATTKINFWVCDLGSGLLGYAQFPGGSAATDGVVMDYQAFGTTASYALYATYNKGRTLTHELGHWFNLRHIWGDKRCGTDNVTDTPAHDDANYGCPSSTHKSLCTGKPLEQWMNYMDYTDDACMYMFSAGQKTRMDAAIDGARSSYIRAVK